ncbi:MAG TPA: sigma-70 family RNA polymerase sigma factor [Caulobacteraceae bacterium]|nr:sigma-70 family RNA polymerase sigma factor [Caulobacteraceae bacterium]
MSGTDPFADGLTELLPRLRRFGRALTGDSAEADDLVQTALERAWARRRQWREGTRLDAWIFAIMRNAWTDEARARARRRTVDDPDEALAAVADPGIASLEEKLEARAAERALAALPAEQRAAVALVLIEGLSYREAAQALGVPEGTLTSRLGRARTALAERLLGAEGA